MRTPRQIGLAILMALQLAALAAANPPHVSYIFPAGGQRGTTVSFRVGGHDLHDACAFEMLGEGVQASPQVVRSEHTVWFEGPIIPLPDSQQKEDYPKDYEGQVSIDADAPLGIRRWRVRTSQGATATMPFVVGDLPEIVEDEIDGDPIPVPVAPPLTINGRIFPREDVDLWSFNARRGQTYTCEVLAARIGSPLDSRLEVIGPGGQSLAENIDARGSDSWLRFTAPEDGAYQVRIHDIGFGGLQHYVYRLTITAGVVVDGAYPLGGRAGETIEFELSGQNLPATPTPIKLTAAAGELQRHRLRVGELESNVFWLDVGDAPEQLENEPNDSPAAAASFQPPATLNGRIGQPGDVDHWRFTAKAGELLRFEVKAGRLGSPLDSVLKILDAEGRRLAENDDLDQNNSDSLLRWKAPAVGQYVLAVSERFSQRGGPEFAYRLHVAPDEGAGDFQLQLPTDALIVERGGEVKFKLSASRSGGFKEPIVISVAGLPAGVTAENVTLAANKNDAQLVFKAAETAKIDATNVVIEGTAKTGEATLVRRAVLPRLSNDDSQIDQLLLAVAMPTPFKIVGEFETRFAARGATYERLFRIERGDFTGPLTIRLADRQIRHLQGVTGPTLVVPAEADEFVYPIRLAPWMELGRTSRTVVTAVGVVEDADGVKHNVSYNSDAQADQIIVLVDPGQLDVDASSHSLIARPGETATVHLRVSRGVDLHGAVRVDLVAPAHIHGVHAEPVVIAADQNEADLTIRFDADRPGPFNAPLTVRATLSVGGETYIDEENLRIVAQP